MDPLWNDDETGFILNPEAVVFGNPIAQAACAADCIAASSGFAQDALFWCGGCQGSLYPFTGTLNAHVGGRTFAWLNPFFRLWKDYEITPKSEENLLIVAHSMILIKKIA